MYVNRRELNIGRVHKVAFAVSYLSHVSAKNMQKHTLNKIVLAIKSAIESKKELKKTF